jgi:hypothetical protein
MAKDFKIESISARIRLSRLTGEGVSATVQRWSLRIAVALDHQPMAFSTRLQVGCLGCLISILASTPVGCAKLGQGPRTYEVEGIGPAL